MIIYHRARSQRTQPKEKPKLYCGQSGLIGVSSKLFLKRHISSFLHFVFSYLTLFPYFVFSCLSLFFLSPFNVMLSFLFFLFISPSYQNMLFPSFWPCIILREHKPFKICKQDEFFPNLVHTSLMLLLEHQWKM